MLKILLTAAIMAIAAPKVIAEVPLCYMLTPTGKVVNLNSICGVDNIVAPASITATNLSLNLPDAEYNFSPRIEATITNHSRKSVRVAVVQLQIKSSSTILTTVPIFMNETLAPGQSVPASGLFNQSELKGIDSSKLSVSFQGWH